MTQFAPWLQPTVANDSATVHHSPSESLYATNMVLTPSIMAPLATKIPEFEPDTDGKSVGPTGYRGQPLVSRSYPTTASSGAPENALTSFAQD